MDEIVARRRAEQRELIAVARDWAPQLAARVDLHAVVVAGSVARGDFNTWSDIDVVVVASELPAGLRDRLDVLTADSPPRVQPFGYTPGELPRQFERHNALLAEAAEHGVVVWGEPLFELAERSSSSSAPRT